jgi:HK97 family phage portal protein
MEKKGNFLTRFIKKSATNVFVTLVSPARDWALFATDKDVTPQTLIENSETIPQIFSITTYKMNKIASIPIKVVNKKGKDAPDSQLYQLIEGPNKYQSFSELIKLLVAYYELMGNSFLYKIPPDGFKEAGVFAVPQLYCLPFDKTLIVLKRDKTLPAWMNEVAGYQCTIGGKEYNIPAENVLHERYFSLRYDNGMWVYGISKYVAGSKIARELKAIHEAKVSIVEKRGAMGFISNDGELPDREESKKALEKLEEEYGLGDGKKKVILTTEKLRWQQMSLGIAELQLIENKKASFDDLCWLNEMDPVIFSTEGSTFSNKKEAEKKYILQVIKPWVDNFYKQLSIFINNGQPGDEIKADWSKVEEIQADRKEMTAVMVQQIDYAVITPHGAFETLYGEDAENNAPEFYFRKTSLVPAETEIPKPVDPNAVIPINRASGSLSPDTGPITADMVRQLITDNANSNGNGN